MCIFSYFTNVILSLFIALLGHFFLVYLFLQLFIYVFYFICILVLYLLIRKRKTSNNKILTLET